MQTKTNTNTTDITATVSRFLQLGSNTKQIVDGCVNRGRTGDTQIVIRRDNGKLRIAYEFTDKEAAILETLSEVSGIPLEALANDAVCWTRSYISELPEKGSGQVYDLLEDDESAFGASIPRDYRKRTRAFLEGLKKAWGIGHNDTYQRA